MQAEHGKQAERQSLDDAGDDAGTNRAATFADGEA
jgi:hypothetical protein